MTINSVSPEKTYRIFLKKEARKRLFEPFAAINPAKTAFFKYRFEAKVIKRVDGVISSTLIRYSCIKTLAYLKAKKGTELYWMLKKEYKDLAHLLPKMAPEDAEIFETTRSILTRRPNTRPVIRHLLTAKLGDVEDRKENWITSVADSVMEMIIQEFAKLPGEKRIDAIRLDVEYANLSDLDTIITQNVNIELRDECNTCKVLQTTALEIHRCRCRQVFYCDQICKELDYPEHKKSCSPSAPTSPT